MALTSDQIAALYQSELGRAPDAAGLAYWSGQNISPDQLQGYLYGSAEHNSAPAASAPAATSSYGGDPYAASNPYGGSVVGVPAGATNVSGGANQQNITNLYQSVLGRTPSASEVQYWAGSGMDLNAIAQAFATSPEYAQSHPAGATGSNVSYGGAGGGGGGAGGAPNPGLNDVINQYYQTYLHRAPTAADLTYWSSTGANPDALKTQISQSPEGSIYDFYQNNFNRLPNADEVAYWQGTGLDRNGLWTQIHGAPEEDQTIGSLYQSILGRAATPEEIAYWKSTGKNFNEITQAFQQSPEYTQAHPQPKPPGTVDASTGWTYGGNANGKDGFDPFTYGFHPEASFFTDNSIGSTGGNSGPLPSDPIYKAPHEPPSSDQINVAYQAYLNRAPDSAGQAFWSGNGNTYDSVIDGVAHANEPANPAVFGMQKVAHAEGGSVRSPFARGGDVDARSRDDLRSPTPIDLNDESLPNDLAPDVLNWWYDNGAHNERTDKRHRRLYQEGGLAGLKKRKHFMEGGGGDSDGGGNDHDNGGNDSDGGNGGNVGGGGGVSGDGGGGDFGGAFGGGEGDDSDGGYSGGDGGGRGGEGLGGDNTSTGGGGAANGNGGSDGSSGGGGQNGSNDGGSSGSSGEGSTGTGNSGDGSTGLGDSSGTDDGSTSSSSPDGLAGLADSSHDMGFSDAFSGGETDDAGPAQSEGRGSSNVSFGDNALGALASLGEAIGYGLGETFGVGSAHAEDVASVGSFIGASEDPGPDPRDAALGVGSIGTAKGEGAFGLSGPVGDAPGTISNTEATTKDAMDTAAQLAGPDGLIGSPGAQGLAAMADAPAQAPGTFGADARDASAYGVNSSAGQGRNGFASPDQREGPSYLDGKGVEAAIADLAEGRGASPRGAAGLAGNFATEGSMRSTGTTATAMGYSDPTNYGAIGLAQNRGGRAEAMMEAIGKDPGLARAAAAEARAMGGKQADAIANRAAAEVKSTGRVSDATRAAAPGIANLTEALSGTLNAQVNHEISLIQDSPGYSKSAAALSNPNISAGRAATTFGTNFEGTDRQLGRADKAEAIADARGQSPAGLGGGTVSASTTPGGSGRASPDQRSEGPSSFIGGLGQLAGVTSAAAAEGPMAMAQAPAVVDNTEAPASRAPAWAGDPGPDQNPFSKSESESFIGEGKAGRTGVAGRSGEAPAKSQGDGARSAPAQAQAEAPATAKGGLGQLANAPTESLPVGTTIAEKQTTVDPLSRTTMDQDGNRVATIGGKSIGNQIGTVGTNLAAAALGPLGLVGQLGSYATTGKSLGANVGNFMDAHSSPSQAPIGTAGADAASQVDYRRQTMLAQGVAAGHVDPSDAFASLTPAEQAQVRQYMTQLAKEQGAQQPGPTDSGFTFSRRKASPFTATAA